MSNRKCIACGKPRFKFYGHVHLNGQSFHGMGYQAMWCETCSPGWRPNKVMNAPFCIGSDGKRINACGGSGWELDPDGNPIQILKPSKPGEFNRFEDLE